MPPMTPELGPPIDVLEPETAPVPIVLSSPHSGRIYPPSLLRAARLGPEQLRALEDRFVDRLFESGPELGAPLLRARFARAYVDPNREAFELDPALFRTPLPAFVNADSTKARAGLGTIPSRVAGGAIYRSRLNFEEAERRVRLAYLPYHRALEDLLVRTQQEFGTALLLDCHSMPNPNGNAAAEGMIDFALGDRFGSSCAPLIVERIERFLRRQGLRVARNRPYAGGHITCRYGRPAMALHALQIEIRRSLFMDERTGRPHGAMAELAQLMRELIAEMAEFALDRLVPRHRLAPRRLAS